MLYFEFTTTGRMAKNYVGNKNSYSTYQVFSQLRTIHALASQVDHPEKLKEEVGLQETLSKGLLVV